MATYPDRAETNPLAADCRRCPALVENRECIAWGNGAPDAALVVVGEAPGKGDPDAHLWKGGNWTGMAYTSRHSGRRVRSMMTDIGVGQGDCYFTNAVKCFPADGTGSNRAPTARERANCRPYLHRELQQVDPDVVLATGKQATLSLLSDEGPGFDSFLASVLSVFECAPVGAPVVPLLHPSYQDVWFQELGHTRESYLRSLRAKLDEIGV